jgi:hypothetical protein
MKLNYALSLYELIGTVDALGLTLQIILDDYVKGCCVRLVMSAYVLCVSEFFCRMYIDSNRRDSRI